MLSDFDGARLDRFVFIQKGETDSLRHHCIQAVEAETGDVRNCQTETPLLRPQTK